MARATCSKAVAVLLLAAAVLLAAGPLGSAAGHDDLALRRLLGTSDHKYRQHDLVELHANKVARRPPSAPCLSPSCRYNIYSVNTSEKTVHPFFHRPWQRTFYVHNARVP
jgi:hypothetical protein